MATDDGMEMYEDAIGNTVESDTLAKSGNGCPRHDIKRQLLAERLRMSWTRH